MKIEKEIITGQEQFKLENGTVINRYTHVLAGAEIGSNCMIGEHCYIASDVKIGDGTRIQNGNNIWNGLELGNDVFIAPCVVFTNHRNPQDRFYRKREDFIPDRTIIRDRATVCANSTVVAPCVIGKGSLIAAGSIVLTNVEDDCKVWGVVKRKKES